MTTKLLLSCLLNYTIIARKIHFTNVILERLLLKSYTKATLELIQRN